MRILVHGDSLDSRSERMQRAAAALALRGHEVLWTGAHAPRALIDAGIVTVPPGRASWLRTRAELVVGGSRRPLRTAFAAWLAGAHAMVLGVDRAAIEPWNILDRWAWGSLAAARVLDATTSGVEAAAEVGEESDVAWSCVDLPAEPDATHPDTEVLERVCERLRARTRGHAARPAAFVDRDGTLVIERGYLSHAEDLELLPHVAPGLATLQRAGYAIVVLSNQSGVGRGFFPLRRVYEAMAKLRRDLTSSGVDLDAIYFCPHRPEAGCACRKPGTALLRDAARNLNLALKRSAMIGDKLLDVETGHRAGGLGILLRTGYGADEESRTTSLGPPPDYIADDLMSAAKWLAARGGDID